MSDHKIKLTELIKQEAHRIGFDACGITHAKELNEDRKHLQKWLDNGYHGSMQYMENHFEKRTDPSLLVDGAKSVIIVLLNYYPEELQKDIQAPILSKYAYGKDYHDVMKDKLKALLHFIDESVRPVKGRVFVDSAPVLERALAARAGLGWIGKNANLISPRIGSFVFIGSVILDLELIYDNPIPDYCGGCTKCLKACPTDAILNPGVINSNRCISYLTIENKEEIPESFKGKFENRVFGCDICQDVCPWNRKVIPTGIEDFRPIPDLLKLTKEDWQNMDMNTYRRIFNQSAVKRAKFSGLKRNIEFLRTD